MERTMINDEMKNKIVNEARLTLMRLNRNRSAAKRKRTTSATEIIRFDRAIELANRRLERRRNLPISETPAAIAPAQKTRIYQVKT